MELDKAKKLLEALGKMQAEGRGEGLPCPRCGRDYMAANPVRNALSRRVKVYICDACGMDEALRDMAGLEPLPLNQWAMPLSFTDEETDAILACHSKYRVKEEK